MPIKSASRLRPHRSQYHAHRAYDRTFSFVAVNDVTDAKTLAHLLKYDSVLAICRKKVRILRHHRRGREKLQGFQDQGSRRNRLGLRRRRYGVEFDGLFTKGADAKKHLRAPVKKSSSRARRCPDATFVLGVNDKTYDLQSTTSFPTASCTPTASRPSPVLQETFGIHSGTMTTIPLLHQRSEAARSPAQGSAPRACRRDHMIPSSTGPQSFAPRHSRLKGKLDGYAMRGPLPTSRVVDLTVFVEKPHQRTVTPP